MIATPSNEKSATGGGLGNRGATATLKMTAKAKRVRAGVYVAPNIGATIKHAPIRMNGQNHSLSQAIKSVTEINILSE
jgi:hypothetical protein